MNFFKTGQWVVFKRALTRPDSFKFDMIRPDPTHLNFDPIWPVEHL